MLIGRYICKLERWLFKKWLVRCSKCKKWEKDVVIDDEIFGGKITVDWCNRFKKPSHSSQYCCYWDKR